MLGKPKLKFPSHCPFVYFLFSYLKAILLSLPLPLSLSSFIPHLCSEYKRDVEIYQEESSSSSSFGTKKGLQEEEKRRETKKRDGDIMKSLLSILICSTSFRLVLLNFLSKSSHSNLHMPTALSPAYIVKSPSQSIFSLFLLSSKKITAFDNIIPTPLIILHTHTHILPSSPPFLLIICLSISKQKGFTPPHSSYFEYVHSIIATNFHSQI